MSEEEKELINTIERALSKSEIEGNLVSIIYNYIVRATINLIKKLQKENDDLRSEKQLEIDTAKEVLHWKGRYKLLEDDFLRTCCEYRNTLERLIVLRDTLDKYAYSDVIEKIDEILNEGEEDINKHIPRID